MALLVTVGALAVAGCSGGAEESGSSTTETAAMATTLPGPPGTGDAPAPDTTIDAPPPASVLPPPVTAPGAPAATSICLTLVDTLPVSDLLPRDGVSWPDERQRVVSDARRDAALYARAATSAPLALSGPLGVLGDFAGFVADSTQEAADAASARSTIDTYPAQGEVGAAASEVDRWERTNCP
jgi:hypothetical protein